MFPSYELEDMAWGWNMVGGRIWLGMGVGIFIVGTFSIIPGELEDF